MATLTTINDVLEDNKILTGVIDRLMAENEHLSRYVYQLKREIHHKEANHKQLVNVNAILRQRPDLPVDRIPAIKALDEAYERINRLTVENKELKCQLKSTNKSRASK